MMDSAKDRRSVVEKERRVVLPQIAAFSFDEDVAGSHNCENLIGGTQIPLGIAGPIHIKPRADYFIPLATTEGALVASVNRGCNAISQSGGASVLVVRVGATRGPVFKVKSMAENSSLYDFIYSNEDTIRKIAESTSHHLKLLHIETNSVGLYRFIRFVYDTKDAMGLNMVTIATDVVVTYIEKETGAVCVSLSGNYCTDKKASWLNVVSGRGFEVWAEAVIPSDIVRTILKTTPQAVYQTWLSKCMIGSAMSGSLGFNAQYANILSALFIATGQDPAHVAECAVGITTAEVVGGTLSGDDKQKESLYMSIYLPDVMVGTVGGGTGLPTQKEALSILGVSGGNDGKNSEKLAEIVGGAVLAGEVSFLVSLSEGSLARAHIKLGRGGK